jgi:nicotinamidase-related amidase
MENFSIDVARTALVLIDLQHSNLAQEMRERRGRVVYVRVLLNEMLALPVDAPLSEPGGGAVPPPDASRRVPEAGVEANDLVIAKRQWGAFYGTELDQALRRRNMNRIIIGGIATNFVIDAPRAGTGEAQGRAGQVGTSETG